jgi:uncharacterized protein (TIRG00374 family)
MTLRKASQLAIGLLLAALFLWLAVRHIEPGDMRRALERANGIGIAGALLAVIVGYSCRIERWRLMLVSANAKLRWRDCAGPLLASFAANNVLPFRAGDVMRSFAFNTRLGATPGVVIATVFVERLLDLLVVLGLLGAALAAFGGNAAGVAGVSGMLLLAIVIAVSLVLRFPGVLTPLARALAKYAARWLPRVGKNISNEVDSSMATLQHLAGTGRMTVLVLWSVAAWTAEGCAYWFTALCIPSLTEPLAGWLALPAGALATLVPSTPGYVGTFDYFTAQAMVALGNDRSSSTIYALLIHAVIWLPATLGGGVYLLIRSMKVSAIRVQEIRPIE